MNSVVLFVALCEKLVLTSARCSHGQASLSMRNKTVHVVIDRRPPHAEANAAKVYEYLLKRFRTENINRRIVDVYFA